MNGDPSGAELEQGDGATPFGIAITATPILLVVAHLVWPHILLLKLAAIGVVVLVSCLIMGMLYEAIAARRLGGPTEFTPHVGCLLGIVILSVVLGFFWGWLSTGILLLLSALVAAGGGWSAMPIQRGSNAVGDHDAEGDAVGDHKAEGDPGGEERGEIDLEGFNAEDIDLGEIHREDMAREREADKGAGEPEPGWEVPSVVTPVDPDLDPRLAHLVRSFNDFGFELYQELGKVGNAFFSPLSVAMALSTLLPGSRGRTREEIAAALLRGGAREDAEGHPPPPGSGPVTVDELPEVIQDLVPQLLRIRRKDWHQDEATGQIREVERDSFRLHLATALFAQERYPLIHAYRTMLREHFRAEIFSLDFRDAAGCAERINHWVELKTEGKIHNLVSAESVDPDTRVMVANAVYFLAAWADAFDEGLTSSEPFHLLPGSSPSRVDVQMMQKSTYLPYWEDHALGLQALEIPYQAMSMLVLLPREGSFESVHDALCEALVERITREMVGRDVELHLPRIELTLDYDLTATLHTMGLVSAFDPEESDLSGISEDPDGLFLSRVIHRARVKVDEQGTEAAAATLMGMLECSAPEEEPEVIRFRVDRPFFFLIRCQRNGATFFIGRVTDPS